jgi:hypothetical protein
LNGDGYPDLLLGNYGLNSKLNASASFPLKMYVNDFDKNGLPEQLLAVQHNGQYYPFAEKALLEKQLPYLKHQYLSYTKMAGKTVREIFGEKLDSSILLQAASMQSVVMLNDRKGGFIVKPLPAPFQWAPLFSFYTDDFNGDGQKDILAAGNFFGVTPYEGRYDAMPPTMGYGNGKGDFLTTLPHADPLLISGEIRDIQQIRIGREQKCLILARNNDSLVFLAYQ